MRITGLADVYLLLVHLCSSDFELGPCKAIMYLISVYLVITCFVYQQYILEANCSHVMIFWNQLVCMSVYLEKKMVVSFHLLYNWLFIFHEDDDYVNVYRVFIFHFEINKLYMESPFSHLKCLWRGYVHLTYWYLDP